MTTTADILTGPAPATFESDLLPTDDHYRLTGELATPAEKPPTSEADRELERQEQELQHELDHEQSPNSDASAASSRATAAAPRTTPPQKKGRDARIQELLADRKRDRERIDTLERQHAAPREETPAPQPAAAKAAAPNEPKLTDIDPTTGKPKYTTMDQYLADVRKFDREQIFAEFDGRQTKAQQERTEAEQKRVQAENEQVISKEWTKRVDAAREKYPDFDDVALRPDDPSFCIPPGSAADLFILESDHGTDVLYYLGQHPEVLEGFYNVSARDAKGNYRWGNKLSPIAQARALAKIEAQFEAAPAPPKPPSAKRVTNAPPPPHQVSGKNTTSLDEVEKAVNDDDQAAYVSAANARDLARRSGRKGR
jgi:hypothetical protein